MDNSQKALQMAFAAFLFVIAATTAIFLYTTLIINAERIMVISDNNNMSAEYVDFGYTDYTRYIDKDEVIMTILDIENNKSYIDKIIVDGFTFNSTDTQEHIRVDLKSWLITASSTYTSTYNVQNKTLKYTAS